MWLPLRARSASCELPRSPITIAGISFDHHHCDERGDVLYLNVGEPRPAARGLETPDGHAIHYDESGPVIGIPLLNVRRTLERDGQLTVSLPPEHLAGRRSTADPRCRLTGLIWSTVTGGVGPFSASGTDDTRRPRSRGTSVVGA